MIHSLPSLIATSPLDFLSGDGFELEGTSGTLTPQTMPAHPKVPEKLHGEKEHRQQIARRLNDLIGRAANCCLDVTLNANSTTTTITDARISAFSAVAPLMALGADAAADLDTIWAFSIVNGAVTLIHRNAPGTARTIRFGIFG